MPFLTASRTAENSTLFSKLFNGIAPEVLDLAGHDDMDTHRVVLFVWLVWIVHSGQSAAGAATKKKENNQFYRIDRVNCTASEYHCDWSVCRLLLLSRNKQDAAFGCVLRYPIDKIFVRIVLYYKFKTYRPFMIDVVEDFCTAIHTFLRGDIGKTPMLSTLLNNVVPNSNINHECPYVGNVTARGLMVGDVLFKDIIPAGKYMIELDIYTAPRSALNSSVFKLNLFFTIPAAKIADSFAIG